MKKKLLITITVILTLAVGVAVLAGCTESLKQKAIATEYSDKVSDNGGMAVVYGKYLYFVNGYAGESADNTFGEVVKGAIARVELKDNVPVGDAEIIVPKNVYGTDTNYGGIYIVDDYIYYATTSTESDSNGKAKTGKCVLMRTKVNGADTQEIKKFDDHSIVFKVVGDKLVYIRSNGIYSIDLKSKKFNVTTVEENIASGYVMDDVNIYYNVYANGDSSNQIMKVYPLAGGDAKEIVSAEIYKKTNVKYTFGILSVIDEGSKVRIFYSKTDSTTNKEEQGIYALLCDKATYAYSASNEVEITINEPSKTNLAYSKFYKAGEYYLGVDSQKIDLFKIDVTKESKEDRKGRGESINVGSSITVFDTEETADGYYLWYFDSNKVLHKIKFIDKADGRTSYVEGNEVTLFKGSYDSTYVGIEKIGNVLYYLNSNISNNAYYYVIDEEKPGEGKGKILGKITEADIIAAF